MTTSTDNVYCPSCDVRAIGMEPREGERIAPVAVFAPDCGEQAAHCTGCGCIFNTGTTRAYGVRMVPLTEHTLRWHVATGRFCTCEAPRAVRPVDVNYTDMAGTEQRVHGWRCDDCLGWTQVG